MQPSEELIAFTEKREGFRAIPYRDSVGLATVGFGHLIQPGETFPDPLTLADGETMLRADMAEAAWHVLADVSVPMTQGEFDALCDFVYNLGDRLKSSTLLQLLNAGQTEAAEQQLLKWDLAGGKPCAGLLARRTLEMGLWNQGVAG